ncbi:MAG: low specificity L-threonine aldolase [Pseudomonadota bacterium]
MSATSAPSATSAGTPISQHFASDNNAGICPAARDWMLRADASGHEVGYGDDRWTQDVCDRFRTLFDTDCEVFFVFNGTAANALALATLGQSYNAIICHASSHIEVDECGAPEFFSNGAKLITADGPEAKLRADDIEHLAVKRSDLHFPKARAVSLTQATEFGTLYNVDELRAIASIAKRRGLNIHMDGARFANAVARLDVHPSEITWRAGVDVLAFGGTKNGLPVGEAVIFFKKELAEDFAWRVKQAGQLASKMRYVSAPWLGLLDDDVWLKNARHANAMADRLAQGLTERGIRLMFPVEANAVFATIDPRVQAQVRTKGWRFYTFVGDDGCRLMCAWDTAPEVVDRFVADVAEAQAHHGLTSAA